MRTVCKRRCLGVAALLGLALGLSACAAPPPPAADGRFALEAFFDGASRSRGEIETLFFWTEDFSAGFAGKTTDGRLALDETFHFKAGNRLQRWALSAVSGGRYEGTVQTEDDKGKLSVPVPVAGYRTANGAVLDYDGYAPGGGNMLLHFRHWMETEDDGTVLNRVRISKYGLPIAGATVVFSKPPAGT